MTERQRLQRAHMLVVQRAAGCSAATAWRKVNPGIRASDKSAAERCRREVDWIAQWLAEHPGVPVPAGDWRETPPKRCIGVADRPCGKELSRRRKRCTACAAEQRRLMRPGYNRNYFRTHRKSLNAKRNKRRRRQHQREGIEAAAAAKQEERVRRADMLRMIVDKRTGKKSILDPRTGKREELNPGAGF